MKLALCICPQWSIETPSFAIGSLKSHIKNNNVVVKQFDLNVQSSLYVRKINKDLFYDWGNDKPWNSKRTFINEVLPIFKDFWNEKIEELSKYDVVCFTTYTSNIMATDYIARYLKERNKKIQIWYGGPHSWYSDCGGLVEDGKYREFVDVACGSNEGETIIADLVNSYEKNKNYENIKGIYRWNKMTPSFPTALPKGRSGREPVFNGDTRPIILNTLERPSWDNEVIYHYDNLNQDTTLPIQSSRGCTFKCTFCSETRLYRFKNNDKLLNDIKSLIKDTQIKNFWFTDSLINGSMSRFEDFVNMLSKEKIDKLKWGGYFRIHKKLNDNLLKKAVKSGLDYMNVGMENGVPKILNLMEKRQKTETISMFLKSAYKNNVHFNANWIPGFPKENHIDFMTGLKFLYDNKKYFGRNGGIFLMQSTDIIDNTPLDIYKDKFDVSNDKKLFNSWVSKDSKNFLLVRHLRSYLTEVLLKSSNIRLQSRILRNALDVKKCDIDFKKYKKSNFFDTNFLNESFSDDTKQIIKNEIELNIKTFSWLIANVSRKSDISISINDYFKTYDLKDSHFLCNIDLQTKGNKLNLDVDYEVKVHKDDNSLDNKNINIKENFQLTLDITKCGKDERNHHLYLDSLNYDKYNISLPRTSLTRTY
jgi:radical SAM superfamily enzyme YgiQ (UPF0313 family)|tara:strand:+ start:510 stop:2450 length:1941 start_codon:yes stop_codon:yes gene_type:complete